MRMGLGPSDRRQLQALAAGGVTCYFQIDQNWTPGQTNQASSTIYGGKETEWYRREPCSVGAICWLQNGSANGCTALRVTTDKSHNPPKRAYASSCDKSTI